MGSAEPQTVGLLTEPYLYEWQVRALKRLYERTDLEVTLVVSNERNAACVIDDWNTRDRIGLEDVRQFLTEIHRERAWTFVLAERNLARLVGETAPLWHRRALEDVSALTGTAHVQCRPDLTGSWAEFPESVVSQVEHRCDVVIRFGFGLIRGDILEAPDYGVLSFHPADIRRFRGLGPPAIFYDGRSVAGATLQRLTDSIDGGEIVAVDDVPIDDCDTMWDVFDRTATLQIDLLADGLENLSDPSFEPTTVPESELGAFYSRNQRRSLGFAARILARNLRGRLKRQYRQRVQTLDESEDTRPVDAETTPVSEPSDSRR
ncbi:formyltransferase family protein [Natronolimnobius baerhuensis]|uniref:Methionyl-tRNA formyltransferase n=1 Tax=Natronolimnobius baerhuensis TaxID=253108 RepID=A0A202EBZ2_9EURY|nr:formyltransferase family protein [Natronolimnobius baerhuensis]OVE85749.1 methionyl-tRNA formyltransferase [Natronolimnobius baerhuensis]